MTTFSDDARSPVDTLAIRVAAFALNRVPFGSQVAGMTPPAIAFRFDTPLVYTPPPTLAGAISDYLFGV